MENLESRLNDMNVNERDGQIADTKWGWPLKELYRHGLAFYKGNEPSIAQRKKSCSCVSRRRPPNIWRAVYRRNLRVNDHIIKIQIR